MHLTKRGACSARSNTNSFPMFDSCYRAAKVSRKEWCNSGSSLVVICSHKIVLFCQRRGSTTVFFLFFPQIVCVGNSENRTEKKKKNNTPVPFIILLYVFVVFCLAPNIIRLAAFLCVDARFYLPTSFNICARTINER